MNKERSAMGSQKIVMVGMACVLAVLLSACDIVLPEQDNPAPEGYGTVKISFAGYAWQTRTVLPASKVFDSIEYYFTRLPNGSPEEKKEENGLFTLETGTYTIIVKAYSGVKQIAQGTSEQGSFTVGSGATVNLRIKLTPTEAAISGNGIFKYHITYPAGATVTTLRLDNLLEANRYIDLMDTIIPGGTLIEHTEADVPAGYYLLTVKMSYNGRNTGKSEVVYIYDKLTSTYAVIFEDSDFIVGTPLAPLNLAVTRDGGQVTLSWEAPFANGGSTITGYQVSSANNSWVTASGSLSHTFSGLAAGNYTFRVRAVNDVGVGEEAAIDYMEDPPVSQSRYKIISHSNDADRIDYSYRYQNYDFYYVYLGRMADIPIWSYETYRFIGGFDWTYTISQSNITQTSVRNTVTSGSESARSVASSNTTATTTGGSVSSAIESKFEIESFGVTTGITAKTQAEANWSRHVSGTLEVSNQLTTSLSDTVEEATSYTLENVVTNSFHFSSAAQTGYYRFSVFAVSDVYIYIIKDVNTGGIYYEFREHIVPDNFARGIDYSPTASFEKSGAERFNVDIINILDNLPVPQTDLSDAVPYGWYTSNPNAATFAVSTAAQLEELVNIVNGTAPGISRFDFSGRTVTLTSDINLNNKAWTPIGSLVYPFYGTFEGGGKTVSGLYINSPAAYYQGLFGFVFGGVRNLAVSGTVIGKNNLGGVVGLTAGTVQNCSFSGYITGASRVGGVVGSSSGTVQNCRNAGTVNGDEYTGGVVGFNSGTVENSYSTGNVTGTSSFTGGVTGYNYNYNSTSGSIVRNCFSTGTVTGYSDTGGIAGENSGIVENSYSTGSVTGNYITGGVVGENNSGGTVRNSYSTSSVSSTYVIAASVGGVVGQNSGMVEKSYSTGSINGAGSSTSGVGGVVGTNKSDGAVRNCVAMNPSIIRSSGTGTTFGRVVGSNSGTLTSNYGLTEMTFTGVTVTVSSNATGIHGTSVSRASLNTVSWWTTSGRWNTAAPATAWDFTNVWQWDIATNLPVLR